MKRRNIDGFFGTPVKKAGRTKRTQALRHSPQQDVFTSQREQRSALIHNASKTIQTKAPETSTTPVRKNSGIFIDGFVNKRARSVYLSREVEEAQHRFVSVRLTQQNSLPSSHTAPLTRPSTRERLRSKEVVVKLPKKWTIRASLFTLVQYLVLAAVAVAAAYSTSIGQWFVLAYALFVIISRQDSRLTFGIALFVLISVPFFQAINQPGVSNNMAVYVYELLVVGTVQALIELKWPKKTSLTNKTGYPI